MYKWILSFFAAVALMVGILGRTPDFDLHFRRVVKSDIHIASLSGLLRDPNSWSHWFFDVKQVQIVSTGGDSKVGAVVQLEVSPAKKEWKRFSISVEILELEQNRLSLKLVGDSSNRIPKLVENLIWNIELQPQVDGSVLIMGTATAHTRSFRSRLLGRLSERILLNQVFYADLEMLGRGAQPIEKPFSLSD